jgi:hypothetical protein
MVISLFCLWNDVRHTFLQIPESSGGIPENSGFRLRIPVRKKVTGIRKVQLRPACQFQLTDFLRFVQAAFFAQENCTRQLVKLLREA